jgi:outer membrane protein OmpA-like peptidoglycan-associated protein
MKLTCLLLFFFYCEQSYSQFFETFDDNRNNWDLPEPNENGSVKMSKGKCILKVVVEKKGKMVTVPRFFSPDKDFSMEVSFVQKSGNVDNEIGLFWGRQDDSYNEFVISTNGYYSVGSVDSTKWIKTDLVKPIQQENVLRIERKDGVCHFFINGTEIAVRRFRDHGFHAGFENYAKMVLEVDNFSFEQDNPILLVENLKPGLIRENLGTNINTKSNELAAIISADGRSLYFARKHYEGNIGGESAGQDIWISIFDGKKWGKAINPGSPINNKNPNNLASVSVDDNKMVFVNLGKFSYRKKTSEGWSDAIEFGPTFINESDYDEAQLSADGKALLFTIKNTNNLFYQKNVDERDIYVSLFDGYSWSSPMNLGEKINSIGDEFSPFLSPDGRTLYFSTDGRPGYGGVDIFVSKRIGDGWTEWTEPRNLGPEINSPRFDAYYTIPASGDFAYLSSSLNSIGESDIFKVQLPNAAKPDPVVLIFGKTLNAKDRNPVEAKIILDDLGRGKEMAEANSDPSSGEYRVVLPYGANYGLHAAAKGYLSVNENMELANIHEYTEIQKDLLLLKIEVGETLQLNNVFFEQGKPILKSESFPELDRLFKILIDNPKMHIELAGHTDNVGPATALLKLSQERVEAVKKYLDEKGISSGRIMGKGYGATQPKEKNDTEEHRKMNRRVEFKIVRN